MSDLTIPQAIVVVVMLILGMTASFLSGYSHGIRRMIRSKKDE